MPQPESWKLDYLRSARAGVLGGIAITALYALIMILSTPRPSNGEMVAFSGVVIGLAVGCALIAGAAVHWAREGVRLLAALLAGLFGGALLTFGAELIVAGWPQGEESHGVMVMTVAAALFGALIGAMCWVGGRR